MFALKSALDILKIQLWPLWMQQQTTLVKAAGTGGTGPMQPPLQGFVQPPRRSSPAPHLLFQTNSLVQERRDSPHSAQGQLCLLQAPRSHVKKK